MGFDEAISRIGEILGGITSPRTAQDIVVAKMMFTALGNVYDECKEADISVLTANANLSILEECCAGKFFLSCCLQTLMVSIYSCIIAKAPGYTVRNITINYLALCNSKSASSPCKECSLNICGLILGTRSSDCGSLISDAIFCLSKLMKGSDIQLRLGAFKALTALVDGSGTRIGDCHPDILKIAGKYVTDKVNEVRKSVAILIIAITKSSSGCTSVSAELLLSSIGKGLEDDVSVVQDAYTRAVATVFAHSIKAYVQSQELAKIGNARGTQISIEQIKPKRRLISKLASAVTTPKKVVDDYQFRSVISYLMKLATKAGGPFSRTSHIAVLGHLVRDCLDDLDQKDFEWLVEIIVKSFADPVILALSYEDQMFFSARMSHLFRYSITSNLSEVRQVSLANTLIQSVSAVDTCAEQELQFSLGELSHVISCLREAMISVVEATHASVTLHLRHPTFGVRSAAAHVLAISAMCTPVYAATFLRTALINADTQAKQLIAYEEVEDITNVKNVREQERLQRMFFFHGHTLALSIFLKNETKLSTRVPRQLVIECLDFGLNLLNQDCLNSSLSVRHIRCSLVRAGSLIVSSCLCTSHNVVRLKLKEMLRCCITLFKLTCAPVLNDDMMMYELMSVEAAAVCLASLLWRNPEIFIQDMETLPLVIDSLEIALRALKGKYQKFKSNFRYRTLHIVLLECFSWLPPGSCSNMQPLFVEGLRVVRDSISVGLECNCLIRKTERSKKLKMSYFRDLRSIFFYCVMVT